MKMNITCKLTSPELKARKATVISSLKNNLIERKELENGYSLRFPGNDAIIDELTAFVKTERLCCNFFDFTITVKCNTTSVLLDITGPEGAKTFINTELGL